MRDLDVEEDATRLEVERDEVYDTVVQVEDLTEDRLDGFVDDAFEEVLDDFGDAFNEVAAETEDDLEPQLPNPDWHHLATVCIGASTVAL